MVRVKLYIEGGGDSALQDTLFRAGWAAFFENAELGELRKMPRIFRGGGREQTFDAYKRAVQTKRPNELPLLLVDSEDLVKEGRSAWEHLSAREGWQLPEDAGVSDVFLMIACMETWFVADREAMRKYFHNCWRASAVPQWTNLEAIERVRIFEALSKATANCGDRRYTKGRLSFEVLKFIDPNVVQQHCPSARRLIERLRSA